MTTLGDVRDRIKRDLVIVGSSDYDAQIEDAIRSALRQSRGKRYWFLESVGTLTLVSGDSTVSLPANYSAPSDFWIISGGQRYGDDDGFDYVDYNSLSYKYLTQSPLPTGRPVACAVVNNTLYLSHTADQDYTLPIRYFIQDATLPSASDSSVWFDDGYDYIRSLAQYIFKRDSMQYGAAEDGGDMLQLQIELLDAAHISKARGGTYA